MARHEPPMPTAAELEILAILWRQGPSTVREVHETLSSQRKTGYTTVLKLLQIMAEKGLVRRDESQRSHIYEARLKEHQTQRQLVSDLLKRAFGGSVDKLVLQLLQIKKISSAELREIRKLLNEAKEDT